MPVRSIKIYSKKTKSRTTVLFTYIGAISALVAIVIGANQLFQSLFGGIDSFREEIALNGLRNEHFLDFLYENEGKVIHINSLIDLSPATQKQVEILDLCNSAYSGEAENHAFLDGYILNVPLVLPVADNFNSDGTCWGRITLLIESDKQALAMSYGGTGIVTTRLNGFFRIESRFYSSPEMRFVLVPYEADAALLNKYQ